MLLTLLVQVVLPLGLVAWLALAPARSRIGYAAQAIGTGLVIVALGLVALWMLLPWWLPYLYALLWAGVAAARTTRRSPGFTAGLPAAAGARAALVGFVVLGGFAAWLSWQAIQGRQPPPADVVDIPLPLGPGTYLVASGGSREIVNGHMMTLDPDIARFRAYRGQSFGVDLIMIDGLGLRASGLRPRDPAAYEIYGEPVYSPCAGTVVAMRNDRPDMPVPVMDLDVIEGNHVLLNCGDFELLLAHFRRGSIRVQAGDRVSIGDPLGVVGNSGKSAEPHLHISAQRGRSGEQPLSGQPLAIRFDGRFPVRNDRFEIPRAP